MTDLILQFAVLHKQSLNFRVHRISCHCSAAILNIHYTCFQTLDLCLLPVNTITTRTNIDSYYSKDQNPLIVINYFFSQCQPPQKIS